MDTFRALAPPEGIKFTPLFAVPIKDDGQRFARLEQSVQGLRNDFDTVTPTIVRLAAIEKDIRELVSQLRTINDGAPIAEAMPVTPVEAVAAPAPAAAPIVAAPVVAKPQAAVAKAAPLAPTPLTKTQPSTAVTTTNKSTTTVVTTHSLPGKDVTGGTEAAPAVKADTGKPAASLPVTPEAASTGQLPPDGAASPSSGVALQQAVAALKNAAPVAQPQPKAAALDLTPVIPENEEQEALQVVEPQMAAPSFQADTAPAAKVVMGPIMGDVRTIRIGDHIDKTRIVLDVTVKAPFKARLENDGKRLVIELPQYDWKSEKTWRAMSAALVSGYRYADGALVLDLLSPAQIIAQTSLPAGDGAGPRIMIDLFAPAVHVK